jgi:hypothetical protein
MEKQIFKNMKSGEHKHFEWVQCPFKAHKMVQEGDTLCYIRRGFKWMNHLMLKKDGKDT